MVEVGVQVWLRSGNTPVSLETFGHEAVACAWARSVLANSCSLECPAPAAVYPQPHPPPPPSFCRRPGMHFVWMVPPGSASVTARLDAP